MRNILSLVPGGCAEGFADKSRLWTFLFDGSSSMESLSSSFSSESKDISVDLERLTGPSCKVSSVLISIEKNYTTVNSQRKYKKQVLVTANNRNDVIICQ